MTVKDAAKFLGVSPQTVYLWVERKQIPHFRVMGRNIRFLKSDLHSFRASFRQECPDHECMTVLCSAERRAESGGFVTGTVTASVGGSQRTRKTGMRPIGDSERGFRPETTTYSTS